MSDLVRGREITLTGIECPVLHSSVDNLPAMYFWMYDFGSNRSSNRYVVGDALGMFFDKCMSLDRALCTCHYLFKAFWQVSKVIGDDPGAHFVRLAVWAEFYGRLCGELACWSST